MANRRFQEFNQIMNEAPNIADFYNKRYLSRTIYATNKRINLLYMDEINMYYRIKGFELYGDNMQNNEKLQTLAKNIVGLSDSYKTPLSFTVFNEPQATKVFFGANYQYAEQVKAGLTGEMLSLKVNNEWVHPEKLFNMQKFNGFLVGATSIKIGTIDSIINKLQNKNFMFNVVMCPVYQEEIEEEVNYLNSNIDLLQRVSKTELSIGSTRTRNFNCDNSDIHEAIEYLEKSRVKLNEGKIGGLWQVVIHISSDDYHTYRDVCSVVSSAFKSDVTIDNDSLSPTVIDLNIKMIEKSRWQIPAGFLGENDFGGLYSNSLFNILELDSLSKICTLPLYSHLGYEVKHLGETSLENGIFNSFPVREKTQNTFSIGRLDNGRDVYLSVDDFIQHVFVTGTTRYGKTTTILKILTETYNRNIPFLVIEAEKKEYWKLIGYRGMENIQVYSSGRDCLDLKINPFQPEDNTLLDSHIQGLIQVFLSLFDDQDPIPQIMTELVYLTYLKKGWEVDRRVRKETDLEYPTLNDMLIYLDECIDNIGYDSEVKNNMKGVFKVRLDSLIRQCGRTFNTCENISIDSMYKKSTIIELDDFQGRNKSFAASLIALKVKEFSKQCNMSNNLRRLFVIEEAHHILPNTELKETSRYEVECSKYFSNMLAEIAAYGTGMIVVDQRPSCISKAVLANTGMKIVHHLEAGENIDDISRSKSLNKVESSKISKLEQGQAIVAMPGNKGIYELKVCANFDTIYEQKLHCLFNVGSENLSNTLVSNFEKNYITTNGYSMSNIEFCIKTIQSRSVVLLSIKAKIALASYLSTFSNENIILKRQELYDYISKLKE